MSQVYHSNARTNQHVREIIQKSDLTNVELADKYDVNVKTISKHKNRDYTEGKSSRPNKIHYALTALEKELIRVIRTLKSFEISRVPKEQKAKAKKYNNIDELEADLRKFLIYYNINRSHGGLRKELKVRTPYEAVKSWFEIEPNEFYTMALNREV